MHSFILALLHSVLICAAPSTQPVAKQASAGLIVELDAAFELEMRPPGPGMLPSSTWPGSWHNLATADSSGGKVRAEPLHGFRFDESSGWTGTGSPAEPHALRFNANTSYVEGSTQIELPELTLEVWAYVEGVGNAPQKGQNTRGATLIGNDFGEGGVSLLITAQGTPMLLSGTTFTPVAADTPLYRWQQVVATFTADKARVYVNGELTATVPMKRVAQKNHVARYMLGAARRPENDFVEADGLRGLIAIARVYNRALSAAQVRQNFDADHKRFNIETAASDEPVVCTGLTSLKGSIIPSVRCCKWDYYERPPLISGTGPAGWPSNARQAFDGYPSRADQPYLRNCWRCEVKPGVPAEVTINYRRPMAVTRYVHWFCEPAAWKSAEILASTDGENWKSLQKFEDLPPDYPQYLPIDQPMLARYYKIIVNALAPSAGTNLVTHEIETNYGPTIGSMTLAHSPIQSEPLTISVRVTSPSTVVEGAKLRLIPPTKTLQGTLEVSVPRLEPGKAVEIELALVPSRTGAIPVQFELVAGEHRIDQRAFTLPVAPKLVFKDLTPPGATVTQTLLGVKIRGRVLNEGRQPAKNASVAWRPFDPVRLGDLAPGQSAPFELEASVRGPSELDGLRAEADGGARTGICRPMLSVREDSGGTAKDSGARLTWRSSADKLSLEFQPTVEPEGTFASLRLLVGGKPVPLAREDSLGTVPFVAAIPGGLFQAYLEGSKTHDIILDCSVIPIQDDPLQRSSCDLEFRLAVDKPKIMFRPHIDWYTIEHGPNFPQLANGHNSATRMLCIQNENGVTLSIVPNTDNLTWGFTQDNEISVKFHMPNASSETRTTTQPAQLKPWQPITNSPLKFKLTFAVRKGDWWDAYRHVVQDIFKFEQPRQWAMSITQMQMLTARFPLRPEVWSEKWQVVRSHPGLEFFYNFYGLTYNIPALYSWYLVSDDRSALDRAQKDVEFLLKVQEKDGPVAGAWFSQYCVEGAPPQLVGRDQAWNRWVMPHATGTSAKTLLWYWEASGKKDGRVFAAAKRGCDWLLKTQRADGAWTYAFDLQGKPVSELSGAGQIWCTWALWKMHQYTGDQKYADAARRSRDAFKKTFMDVHRYEGYWEDVSGAGGKVARSWEGYEPAIACLVFADMGDKELAIEAGKDTATWSWTRVTSTRQYETAYGQTTEQSLCGPSQAQSPMIAVGLHQIYELTGDKLWSDFSGAIKAVNFSADPEQAYGMVATGGWDDPLTGVIGPPYDGTRPMVTPNNSRGDEYGRQIWNNWCTDQFAWLALEWLVREANVRAPRQVKIDPNTYRGTVLGAPGRVKMPEEKCDVQGIDHIDINWVGYQNDDRYMLLIMNHHEKTTVLVRPHEAHLGVPNVAPQLLLGTAGKFELARLNRRGVQYEIEISDNGTALLVWDRLK